MICNLDGTWTLESTDIDNLNLIVAKIVTERANDDKIKTFNTEKFIKYIHDLSVVLKIRVMILVL
jgi:hypothetical protein